MSEILIFGGTSEGHKLAEYCADKQIYSCISVATALGSDLIPDSKYVRVIIGRKDRIQIKKFISENDFSLVIDATHPYAEEVTKNIRWACIELEKKYIRLCRESVFTEYGVVADSTEDAVNILNSNDEIIFSTLGSKEFHILKNIKNYRERLFIRILPNEEFISECEKYGFPRSHIITGTGPYSVNENIEHIRKCSAGIILTKESGAAGGYPEKAEAAKICGIGMITIRRPKESGYSFEETIEAIRSEVNRK